MAENQNDRRVSLDISSRETETIPLLECRLNVPNFFTLPDPEYDDAVFKSRTFQFADATWFFEFHSRNKMKRKKKCEKREVVRGFNVYIERLNSAIQQVIFSVVTLLDANDKDYDIRSCPTNFPGKIVGYENEGLLAYFVKDDPSFDRRETLCLIIQLFCEKSTVSDEDKVQNTTNGDLEMETTKDEENCKVTLELSTRKSISSVVCTLKIPNFFTLPEYDGTTFESRTITFAGASWCFCFSSGMRWNSEEDIRNQIIYFLANMVRLDSEIAEQRIFYSIALLDNNDQVHKYEIGQKLFKEDTTEQVMLVFDDLFGNEESVLRGRDSLTLIFRLFYDKSTEMAADHLQKTTQRGIERLLQNVKSLLLNGQGSDAMLKVEDNKFRVHKVILMDRSPVFASMFQHDTKESSTGIVDIPDCSAAAFEVFLSYLYTGNVDDLTYNNLFDVYHAADKYQVDDLKLECTEFMEKNLSVDNFCEVMTQSLQYIETDLQEKAIKFFCDNVKKIIRTVQWQKYMRDYPKEANELYIKAVDA